MRGLESHIDWAQFTKENRVLELGKKYKEIAGNWQIEIDNAIANYKRVYLQLARGHDKTDRYAWWSLLWLSSTQNARGYAAGVDRDNAALFRDSSRKLKALHPDIFYAIDVQKNIVINQETGSYIETISSDADSAYGLNFDLLIVNDFHAWRDEKFWEVLWTACGKKPGIRVWIESNALTLGDEGVQWKSKFREWVSTKGIKIDWWFFAPKQFLATWQNEQLEQWKETLHPSAYRRLIENEDTSGEISFVTQEQVDAISVLPGPALGWRKKEERVGRIVTAVDLGLKKDATAIATVQSINNPPFLNLLAIDVLTGSYDDPVLISAVERLIHSHLSKYHSQVILMDPWNTQSLIQRYSRAIEWTFTTAHVRELTQLLYQSIVNKKLKLYPNAAKAWQDGKEWDLQKELVNAVIKEASYGQRVDHRHGGFSDRLMAVGMAVHYILSNSMISSPSFLHPKQTREADEFDKIVNSWFPSQNAIIKI